MPAAVEIMTKALIGHDQYVLLCRHRDWQHWTLPGGVVTPGEPVEKLLRRTLHETFDFSMHDYQFSAVIENLSDTATGIRHEIYFLFEVNLVEYANEGTRGENELKWFWWGDIDRVDIRPASIAEQMRDPQRQRRVWAPWVANAGAGAQ